jgi:hypothetical protein
MTPHPLFDSSSDPAKEVDPPNASPESLSTSPESMSVSPDDCRDELWSHLPSESPSVAYIYDSRKRLGFAYIHGLYRRINKHFFQKYPIPTVDRDLRPLMDHLPVEHIPVAPCNMLNLATGQVRPRTPEDYVTYELPTPRWDPSVDTWMSQLGPSQTLRSYLYQFIQGRGPSHITLMGPGVPQLFETLVLLKPIIDWGDRRLYTESHARRKMLEEVSTCRIILVNIGDRTLRLADTREFHDILPIQYRGLVQIQSINQTHSLLGPTTTEETVIVSGVPSNDRTFGAAELLAWIIQPPNHD